MVTWLVGDRTPENATMFMKHLAARVTDRIQLTRDGHGMYLNAVRAAFGWRNVNYAQLARSYGQLGTTEEQRRYFVHELQLRAAARDAHEGA